MNVYSFLDVDGNVVDLEQDLLSLRSFVEAFSVLFKYAENNEFSDPLVLHMGSLVDAISDLSVELGNSMYFVPVSDDDYALLFSRAIEANRSSD